VLKPYLLRMRAEKGEKAVKALLSTAGLSSSVLDNETAWISVAAARRALAALEIALGREAIARRGDWALHPENLGTYVRLLRGASTPLQAYQQLCDFSLETSRVGGLSLEPQDEHTIRITYTPLELDEPLPPDELLSLVREAELASLPRLWGLGEAEIQRESSTAKGDPTSVYLVRWAPARSRLLAPLAGVGAALLAGLPALAAGSKLAALVAGLVAGGLGAGAALLQERMRREQATRIFEHHRIAALERGLQLRGDLPGEEPPAPGELDGTVLGGKYRILKKIGSGGIGVVYSAQHLSLGSTVAVKVLRGAAASDAGEIARLRREAQVQCSIEHPNVVRTLDLDQMPDGSIYVVMELLRGITLAEKLSKDGPVAPGLAIPLFRDVCRALGAAHAKGVVHRDLKPGNIFLCDTGEAKVLDFGMSKLQTAEALTQDGYTLGTPEYMAPEQCIGAPVEPRTDLYAFGVLMYEALTGELPIQAQNRRDLLDLHQRQIPTPMRTLHPELPIPEALDTAILTCLKKRLAERPRDARELEKMLGLISLEGLPRSYARPGRTRVERGA
jgi:serine/threonine-protein kinase